ncbi:hypothetical protein PY32053_01636 [Paracoccus yeei]|uniref:Uncharacterized protein n=1 Tax=Paracoccus yeei TaxID=147645 RepID=A0A386UKM9_9RHOB|nr:hypothetical protein [Paracoccus yeei]AYF01263.1 hypothetical protein PY32053_01636 [Paracoccus yeei]
MMTIIDPTLTTLLQTMHARGLDAGAILIDSLCRAAIITKADKVQIKK